MLERHRLDSGLFLEDEKVLLPWSSSLEELKSLSSPTIVSHSKTVIELFWYDRKFLNSLIGTVSAKFDLSVDHELQLNSIEGLKGIDLSLQQKSFDPRAEYQRIHTRLTNLFGEPSEDHEDYQFGLPLAEWDLEEVLVVHMVFERFGEYCVTEIWRKPLPAWRVKE